MARRRFNGKKKGRKRPPIKNSATYKKGMRNTAIGFGLVGVLAMAVFHRTGIAQQILANTPTFNGEGT